MSPAAFMDCTHCNPMRQPVNLSQAGHALVSALDGANGALLWEWTSSASNNSCRVRAVMTASVAASVAASLAALLQMCQWLCV